MHPLPPGKYIRSHGGLFCYVILGPVCRLYDREELPWPSCSCQWKGKQPSWNRVGKRFIPDMATSRCPSYSVIGVDIDGNTWTDIYTMYEVRLTKNEKDWWVTRKPVAKDYPKLNP